MSTKKSALLKRKRVDRVERVVTRSWRKRLESEKKLSRLNYDCLVKLFRYLSVEDLLNVVEHDIKLLEAAKYVYRQKARDKWVSIANVHNPLHTDISKYAKLIKYFGSDIEHLDISFDDDYHQFDHIIEKLVIEKCCRSMLSLVLQQTTLFTFYTLDRQFEFVEQVILIRGTVPTFMSKFGLWFPKVVKLHLYEPKWSANHNLNMLEYGCPALQEVIIEDGSKTEEFVEWMTNFLVANPGITKIKLKYQEPILALLCERMPRMPNTHLEVLTKGSVLPRMIHFQQLNRLTLRGASMLTLFNISTDRIDYLEIDPLRHHLNLGLLTMLRSNITANTLHLGCKWAGDDFITTEFITIVKSMSCLRFLAFAAHEKITTSEIIGLIKGCKSLEWLFIHSNGSFEYLDECRINKALGSGWVIMAHKTATYPLNSRIKVSGYEFQKIIN